jgi:hypothetical protein
MCLSFENFEYAKFDERITYEVPGILRSVHHRCIVERLKTGQIKRSGVERAWTHRAFASTLATHIQIPFLSNQGKWQMFDG